MKYTEYKEVPAYAQATFSTQGVVDNAGPDKPPVWSGKAPPPPVGAKVKVRINSLGDGAVTGYFTESGFLGMLVKFDNPPEWYVKQNAAKGGRNCIGHVFGIECDL